MKRLIILFIITGLVLVGCHQAASKGKVQKTDSTKQRVYSGSWDDNPIIIEQRNNKDYETVNELTNPDDVKTLIKALGNADWEENVKVDIGSPDYRFSWNSFNHSIWINQEYERLELLVEGQSNYGSLSKDSSHIVFEILTGKKLENYK
ncbi:hypothetical protein JSQ81_05965 [Sporosarcina sp. Marseille-Q4063]|uniref:hypothetical protein n=1 Tax=Sporosarcina sp. Marseille-Q4063 TaxID=2810514 RepID=UPI001BAE967C|nr:hypothetical protein [Sporosarcina sp. Marseille-Q4063]QUW23111.1 hypothetical protein JSQ81_05965 [Sporosarcina sp. Marseille-Q4063]